MPNDSFDKRCQELIRSLAESGQTKPFYEITSPMRPVVEIDGMRLNLLRPGVVSESNLGRLASIMILLVLS